MDLAVAPAVSLVTLGFAAGGVALGTVSGLTPGLHANAFALLLASVAPALPGAPAQTAVAVLAAGVVHTFLDVVPALALGVPDAAMAASALPGHRLVLAGRGREALRLSALGSGVAAAVATPAGVPVTWLATRLYPTLRSSLPLVLAAVVALLLATESSVRAAVGGALAVALSGALGVAALDLDPAAPLAVGGVLTPLFAGLFGAPVLLDALGGAGVPPQDDPDLRLPRADLGVSALAGTAGGALVGYVPGVSAGVAATLSLPAIPGRSGARGFVVATSGANTATAVFALFALLALGTPRTGVLVALDAVGRPPAALLFGTVALASAAGVVLVVAAGDRYLRLAGRVDPTTLSATALCLLVALSVLFAGPLGVALFAVSTGVGLVPPRTGARRVHLMGVLLVPLVLG